MENLKKDKTMSKIIKVLFVSILFISHDFVFGQSKQTYSGNFNSSNFHGASTYLYYEDNSQQRIFEGAFSFNSKALNSSVNISGNFTQNQKSGLWKFKLTNVAYSDIIMKYIITSNVTGSFIKGDLDGNWVLNRTKVISFSNSGISRYSQNSINALSYLFDGKALDFSKSSTVTETANVNFKDNHLIGKFSYIINGSKSKVSGQFNEEGYFDGIWNIDYYQDGILHTEIRNYNNGILLTIKTKDNSTGDIKTIYDKTIETTAFLQNYDKEKNLSKVDNEYFKLADGKSVSGMDHSEFLGNAISIWFNNSSLSESSYALEISKGTNKMNIFPERTIVVDEERMNEEKQVAAEKEKLEEEKKREEEAQEREKQRKIREYQNSDIGRLKESIKKEFNGWLVKGSFETQQDYEKRIKTESETKFKSIVSEKINSNKPSSFRPKYGVLGAYNPESQNFTLYFGNYNQYGGYSENNNLRLDTILIPIPTKNAPSFTNKFAKEGTDGKKIYVIPTNASIVNNKWKIIEAAIIFDNYWLGNTFCGSKGGFYKEGGIYHYDREENNYQTMSKQTKKYDCVDFKSIENSDNLPKEVLFYEWKISDGKINQSDIQSLDFTIESLGIELPKF